MNASHQLKGDESKSLKYHHPFTSCIRHVAFQAVFIGLGLYQIISTILRLSTFHEYGRFHFRFVRLEKYEIFIANKTYNFASGKEGNDVRILQLLENGCASSEFNVSSLINKTISFDDFIAVNGLTFRNVNINGAERLRFILQGSGDDERWITIGTAKPRWGGNRIRFLDGSIPLRNELFFEYRPQWPWIISNVVNPIIWCLGCIGCGVSGILGRPHQGKSIFAMGTIVLMLANGIAVGGYSVIGMVEEAISYSLEFIFYFIMFATLTFEEKHFVHALVVLGLLSLSARFIKDCGLYDDAKNLTESPPVVEASLVALGVFFSALRHRSFQHVTRALSRDQEQYEAFWRATTVDIKAGPLDALEKLLDLLPSTHPNDIVRQCNYRQSEQRGLASSISARTDEDWFAETDGFFRSEHSLPNTADAVAGMADESAPLRSLDQLYSQALGLAPIFTELCGSLAQMSGGGIDHPAEQAPPGLEPQDLNIPLCKGLERWVRRRFVKSPTRAIEKALVCYGGDVSRLVDVCRGRLAFDTLAGLVGCLERIRLDRSFYITRVKDRIGRDDEARACGGYRVRPGPACLRL